jgi:peptide/nickel transport system substrate-binding protein
MRHSISHTHQRISAGIGAVIVIGLAATALAGCSGGGTAAPESSTLTLAASGPGLGFDPADSQPGYFEQFLQPVYDPLFRLDQAGEPTPNIATEWSYDEALTTLNVDIRDDVTFTDGTKLDAEAVKASLEHTKAGTSTTASQLAAVDSVTVVDDDSLTITLSAPDPSLLANLGNQAGMIASPEAINGGGLKDAPVGSGPYTLDPAATTAGTTYSYVRNDEYWNPDDFPFDEVVIKVLPDPTAILNALRTGEVNGGLINGVKDAAVAESAGLNVINFANGDLEAVYLYDKAGVLAPQLADVRVRQAINFALDREAIVEAEYGDLATSTAQMFSISQDNGIYDPALDDTYAYDPEKARSLLAEAGYADGFEVTMPDWSAYAPAVIAAINQNLADVGITVLPETLPLDKLYGNTLQGKYPMGWQPYDANRPWDLIRYQLQADSPWNPLHFEDPTVTDLIAKIQASSGDEQTALYRDLNEYLVEIAWAAPIAAAVVSYATTKDVIVEPQAYSKRPPLYNYRPAD